MRPIPNELLLQQLNWRYATKKFDPTKRISPPNWETIEQTLSLTPTSFGIEPYKFVIVNDLPTRAKLVPFSWNQTQPVDASHFVVFARKLTITEADLDHYLARIAEVRRVNLESLAGFRGMLIGNLVRGPIATTIQSWAANQAYIALGNLMTSAALLGIDTCPMEGFDPVKYDEILGLSAQGLGAVVACAVGYRASDDPYAALPKVRLPRSESIIYL